MNTSEQTNELFTSLAKAQGEMGTAKLDGRNPFFNNARYATLSSIQEVYRLPLAKNGLGLIQCVESNDQGHFVVTRLTHSSGQWLESSLKLFITKQDMQGLGSAITYAKRYSVSSLLGISADEDDDGNHAAKSVKKPANNTVPLNSKPVNQPKPQSGGGTPPMTVKDVTNELFNKHIDPPEDNDFPDFGDSKLSSYKIEFGMNTGKTLGELGPKNVKTLLTWAKSNDSKTEGQIRFIDHAAAFLKEIELGGAHV